MAMYRFWQRLIVPDLRYSQLLYEEALDRRLGAGMSWLDVGCGHGVLPPWRGAAERALVERAYRVVGIDLDWEGLLAHSHINSKVYGDAAALPFPAESFDIVTANMVLEHLEHPAQQFREITRVLRPGGLFVFLTPNARGYLARIARLVPESFKPWLLRVLEGRRSEDVFPTHYRANTTDRIAALCAETGLLTEACERITTVPQFARVLPLAILELMFIRLLSRPFAAELRPNLLGVLRKPRQREAGCPT
jgi:ubiquinone/menaquinone biosynthesis C-methylase UbiE